MSGRPPHIVGLGGTLSIRSKSLTALKFALNSAKLAGATIDLIDLREFDLPMYDPAKSLSASPAVVQTFVERVRLADGMIWSTGAYHGTLAGVTKNAIDYLEFLEDDERPYLYHRAVGLIATAGGDIAGVNALNAMVHSVHALRGTAVPLLVSIPQARIMIGRDGTIESEKWRSRLNQLGEMVVETSARLKPDELAKSATSGNPS